jgi:thiol-disulfide isomerase/thioredoxin
MKTHWINTICLFALVAAVFSAALSIKPLTMARLAGAEKEPEALNLLAPELVGGPWINTAGSEVINLAGRRGKVTIVEFWTFACGNCLANLPTYANWQKQFADKDVIVIGVHTPETEGERVTADVERRVRQLGITYPILVDRDHENWDRWQVEAWPTVYLVDKQGRIRYRWVGELNYRNAGGETKLGRRVEQLLKEVPAKAEK